MINTETLAITPQIMALLSELDEFKGAWRALGTLAPERLAILRQIATIESIGSSTRIEGSTLSDNQVEQLLNSLDIQKFATRHEQEVAGYAEVMDTVFSSWADISITENHIKQLHRDLLRYSTKDERHRGSYKTLRNDVGAFDPNGKMVGIVFETASPFDTPQHMASLLEWFNTTTELKQLHPLLSIALFIVVFLAIHPFQDGNGRLSRVLTTLLLLQAGYIYVSYASLEAVIEQNKEKYYLSLRRTQKTIYRDEPNWQEWVLFFLRALQKQKRHLETKVKKEQQALHDLPPLALIAIDRARTHGRVTNKDIVREAGASPNTVKAILSNLAKQGLLVRHGGGRSTWYGLP